MKMCTKCRCIKKRSEFSIHTKRKDGLQVWCRICKKLHDKNYRAKPSVKARISKYQEKYKKENVEKIQKARKTWQAKNSDYHNKWYHQNKDRISQYRKNKRVKLNLYFTERIKNDINFRLSTNLRKRLNKALKNNQKSGSAISDLGCSIGDLRKHLEQQFVTGMTWKNYGLYGWHIDHIKPLASFDLTDRKQFLEASHYTNLRPLWAKDNLSRNRKT